MAMLIEVHHKSDAGKTAAKACSDQWNRKIRSINESNVQERLEITIGKASQRISRPPEGPDHQPLAEEPWSFIGSPLLWAESRFMARRGHCWWRRRWVQHQQQLEPVGELQQRCCRKRLGI
jgi:hypothetical protein